MEINICKVEAVECFSITAEKPLFSEDSKYVCVICGVNIRVYSVKTGSLIHTLSKHNDRVTGIALNPKNPFQLVSVSIDGRMMIWDYRDGVELRIIEFGKPISGLHFRTVGVAKGFVVCLLVTRNTELEENVKGRNKEEKGGNETVSAVCMDWEVVVRGRGQGGHLSPDSLLAQSTPVLHRLSKHSRVVFTYKGDYLVGFHRKNLLVYSFEQDAISRYRQKYTITCVATHPSKDCIATGDEHGQVLLWFDFSDPKSPPVCSTLHWHAHRVHDIQFTSEGTNLLSVGVEGVLVMWRVETKKCQFRPHLGGPISTVSVSPKDQYFALGMQDNTIKILSAYAHEVETTLGGLIRAYLDPNKKNGVFTGLVRDPRTGNIVLNGTLGHIQCYHPDRRELSQEFDVTSLNYVSQADDIPLVPTVVLFVAFSENGDWMSTVESRNDGITVPELRMKFWKRSQETQSFQLNTLVDPPHYSPVTGVAFQPRSSSLCVTTCEDGHFKMWSLHTSGQHHKWYCHSENYYLREPTVGCVFCHDGSIVAILYKKYVTLWKPKTNEVKRVFTVPSQSEEFRQACFQVCASRHFLLTTTTRQLCVWDLTTCMVAWSVRADVENILGSPFSPHVAAFVRRNNNLNVCLFTPNDPTPKAVFESVCSAPILGAVFMETPSNVPAGRSPEGNTLSPTIGEWCNLSNLYFLSQSQALYKIGKVQKEQDSLVKLKYHQTQDEEQTVFHQVFGLHSGKVTPYSSAGSVSRPCVPDSKLLKIFSGPPHTLPPVSMLCSVFLTSISNNGMDHPSSDGEESTDEEMETNEQDSSRSENEDSEDIKEASVHRHSGDSSTTGKKSSDIALKNHDITWEQNIGDFSWLTDTFKQMK